MRSIAVLATSTILLAACQPDTAGKDLMNNPDACKASTYQSLIGTPVDAADFSGHDAVRIIPPNSAVTMDYSPTRLNVDTDADGIILRIYCG